jgi:hypothetical protein
MSDYLLKPMNPKGELLMSVCKKKRLTLASGTRLSTKTINCLHIVCDHAWNTRLGNIALVTLTLGAGTDSGIWQQLMDWVIPHFGLKFKKKPYNEGSSKKPSCIVFNKFGEGVKIQLHSLSHEEDVEKRFKNKSFSMIYVTELDLFKKLKTFSTWVLALRMPNLKDNELLFLGDCNPADEGAASWIYKMWFELGQDDEFDDKLKALKDQLGLVQFDLSDNIYSSPAEIELVKSQYATDPDLYARYIEGKWVTASENALFLGVFRPLFHVIGEIETRSNPTPELLLPEPDCFQLVAGWDIGESVNSAMAIIEKYVRDESREVTDERGIRKTVIKPVSYFKILDETVIVGEDHLIDDFVREAMAKMRFWEKFTGNSIIWDHWSDKSAFDTKEPLGGRFQHQLVAESSDGKITLVAAMRGRRTNETVRQRIDLFRKLLFQGRIFFSNSKTPNAIQMCKSLCKGRGQYSTIDKGSKHKHIFDAITYAVATECFEELNHNLLMDWKRDHAASGVSSVGL